MTLGANYFRCEQGKLEYFELIVESNTNISNSLLLNAYTIVGIITPSVLNSTSIIFQDSIDNINFYDGYNVANDIIGWDIVENRFYKIFPADTASWHTFRIKLNSIESEERKFIIICRGV